MDKKIQGFRSKKKVITRYLLTQAELKKRIPELEGNIVTIALWSGVAPSSAKTDAEMDNQVFHIDTEDGEIEPGTWE